MVLKTKILVADPDQMSAAACQRVLGAPDREVLWAATGAEALTILQRDVVALVLLDLKMPDVDGLELLQAIRSGRDPDLSVVIITGHSTMSSAIQALRLGARDYLTKPFRSDELSALVSRELEATALKRTLRQVMAAQHAHGAFDNLIGASEPMRRLYAQMARVAAGPVRTVLVAGETGVGKEVVARAIHRASPRAEGPFVTVMCPALNPELAELELWGVGELPETTPEEMAAAPGSAGTAGAGELDPERRSELPLPAQWPGMARSAEGRLAAAEGGTLLLDELAELPLHVQPRLVEAIDTGVLRPLRGGARPLDVRFIATTSTDLAQAIRNGRVRADLARRFEATQITVPPLRERGEDVLLLTTNLLVRFGAEFGRSVRSLAPDAKAALMLYQWPGNVRELRNVIERVVLLADADVLTAEALSLGRPALSDRQAALAALAGLRLDEVERAYIEYVVQQAGGNKSRAARLLGVSRETLRRKSHEWEQEDRPPS